jgi:hypothetical protein
MVKGFEGMGLDGASSIHLTKKKDTMMSFSSHVASISLLCCVYHIIYSTFFYFFLKLCVSYRIVL